MPDNKSLKRYLLVGSIIGAILGIGIALLMDALFADSLNGTWRDAIVYDLGNFFNLEVSVNHPLVFIVFGLVLIVLAGFGGFMGMIFTFFLVRFFSFLKG